MTQKLANKPKSSRKPKARPRRAHSRRNLQGALTSSTCKRANAIGSQTGCARSASWRRLTRAVRGPAGAKVVVVVRPLASRTVQVVSGRAVQSTRTRAHGAVAVDRALSSFARFVLK